MFEFVFCAHGLATRMRECVRHAHVYSIQNCHHILIFEGGPYKCIVFWHIMATIPKMLKFGPFFIVFVP